MMFTTRDTKGHTQMCLTFIFKVNHQGQVTYSGFSEILDLANVRIDTKIKSVACIQPEIRKVIQLICVTLSSKINRQGHIILFNIFDIHDLENVRIDTKINFVSCLQPEMRKVMQKGVWPWFSRSCNKDRIISLSPLDSLTPNTYPWEIFSKNSDGKAKIQGGCINPPPLGRFRLAMSVTGPGRSGSCLIRNKWRVRVLVVLDTYPVCIELTVWLPYDCSGLFWGSLGTHSYNSLIPK